MCRIVMTEWMDRSVDLTTASCSLLFKHLHIIRKVITKGRFNMLMDQDLVKPGILFLCFTM